MLKSARGEPIGGSMAVGALSSSLAGIHRAGVELERSANRVTRFLPEALERLDAQPQGSAPPSPPDPNPEPELNLAREFVLQDLALIQARASMRVAGTALEMIGTLVDLEV